MYENQLAVGIVVHWNDGGWHGTHVVIKFSKKFVWYMGYPLIYPLTERKIYRKIKSKFLNEHSTLRSDCGNGNNSCEDIGKIIALENK